MPTSPFQHNVNVDDADANGDLSLPMLSFSPYSALPPSTSLPDGLGRMKRGPSASNDTSPSDGAHVATLTPAHYRPYKRPKLDDHMNDSDDDSSYPILHHPIPADPQPALSHVTSMPLASPSSFLGSSTNSSGFVSAPSSSKFAPPSFPTPPSVSPNRSPFLTPPASLAPGPMSNTIWFEDGDLVLGVQDVFFRIHASRLVASSGAFAALINAPNPLPSGREVSARAAEEISRKVRAEAAAGAAAGAEYVDGCPFVPLDDDSPRDWAVALEAIYDFLTFQIRPVIFDTLASALRISTKYDVRFLREWAIAQMRTTWPTHLDQMAPMALPHAADAITLARQCCVPEILPAAFYALSVQKWRTGADGGRAHAVLAPADLRRLVAGREALQDALVEIVAAPLTLSPSMGLGTGEGEGDACRLPSAPGSGYKSEGYWTPEGIRFTRPGPTYPPSPAPSPSPKSPTIAAARTRAPQTFTPSTGSSPPPPSSPSPPSMSSSSSPSSPPAAKPAPPPCFEFCAGAAPCRGVLEALWRRALAPDARRAWGTWLVRELHRMATLPRGALAFSGEGACGSGFGSGFGYGGGGGDAGAPPGFVYEHERMWGGGGGWPPGDSPGPAVCARCWEENRRLALCRLDWLCVAIPGMFML